jgi:hypothetical protein
MIAKAEDGSTQRRSITKRDTSQLSLDFNGELLPGRKVPRVPPSRVKRSKAAFVIRICVELSQGG